jgi:hypothetical protein
MARILRPIKFNSRGEPKVMQYTIGKYEMTYNPDDNRFYLSRVSDDGVAIATRANNRKGFANVIQEAKYLDDRDKRRAA